MTEEHICYYCNQGRRYAIDEVVQIEGKYYAHKTCWEQHLKQDDS